jgi:transposase InsO family protein
MHDIYYDPSSSGSFGGVRRLASAANKTEHQTRDWLMNEDAYTLHKAIRRQFLRRKVFVVGIDQLWQIDLADVSHISSHNDDHKFILTIIDCFSRYAFAVPLKNKTAVAVRHAFPQVIESQLRKPVYLQSDKGREFVNAIFQEYLKENGIIHYTSENDDIKCALVERFNRNRNCNCNRFNSTSLNDNTSWDT